MERVSHRMTIGGNRLAGIAPAAIFAALVLASAAPAAAQNPQRVWNAQEQPIVKQLQGLRQLPDDTRAQVTKQLALQIRALPASPNKLRLADGLASLSTEGDFGHATLQEVATTLAEALTEHPAEPNHGQPAPEYEELAQLVRDEHVQASVDSPQFADAMSKLARDDQRRQHPEFTLTDLEGKAWSLQALHGKVVLVNFWATWCPPCRKEIPDLEQLYNRFEDHGLVILGISDEQAATVKPFVADRNVTYPVLLDPGRKINTLFSVSGIPKSFVYDRSGNLVAEAIDMRTQKQFLNMLAAAGLK